MHELANLITFMAAIGFVLSTEKLISKYNQKPAPLDMLLPCPSCHGFHIDLPNPLTGWTNPPHKSHLCEHCGIIWRPADVPTNGVRQVKTHSLADTWALSMVTLEDGERY